MSPIKKKDSATKRSTPAKKTEASNSKTKAPTSKQTLKKKINEFGDEDAF